MHHIKTGISTVILLLASSLLQAQQTDTLQIVQLDSVVVKAFEQNSSLKDVPAAVNYIGAAALQRFSTVSVVPAINTTPGIRMEERSPGSYRFNIRGSSLRSPFGVRNVKVYYNDIPFTDPGGQTYLNNLGFYNYGSVEVIKGPGSSLYGAGTGGVLLIEGLNNYTQPGLTATYTTGSFGLQQFSAAATTGNEKFVNNIAFQHQQSDGYRTQSALRRSVASWNARFTVDEKRSLQTTVLFSDLFYQTPGALNFTEYSSNPKGARPAGGVFPSAEAAQAAIYQKMFVAGISYRQQLTSNLANKTVAYGAFNQLKNPAIRNYGIVNEPHAGGRTHFIYDRSLQQSNLKITAGAEWQQGISTVNIHKNNLGNPDSLQTADDITTRQSFVFVQALLDLARWSFTAGASLNSMKIKFQRWQPQPLPYSTRTFNNEVAPRFAILYKFPQVNIYSSISKGFSPPTTTELLPTGSAVNLDLNAEDGWNYDAGLKGRLFQKLAFDVNAFLFRLQNTIVQRRDAGGGEMYINGGKTKQYGTETALQYTGLFGAPFTKSNFWLSHTCHQFSYVDFKQVNNDYSGNRIPGVAQHTVAGGLDVELLNKLWGAITYYYNDAVPLNDANNAYAAAYHLVGAKIGWQQKWGTHVQWNVAAGVENLLNQQYSLGNDVNGFGGRYYNAAPGRNYFVTLIFNWFK